MKRLVLRITVLGVVAVLGVIAIAQAKRYAADPAPAKAAPPVDRKPVPIPTVEQRHPLRVEVRPTSTTESVPPPRMSLPKRPTTVTPAEPTLAEQPPVESPFAARIGSNMATSAAPDAGDPQGADQGLDTSGSATPPGLFVAEGARYVQPVAAEAPTASTPAASAPTAATLPPPETAAAPITDRYPSRSDGMMAAPEGSPPPRNLGSATFSDPSVGSPASMPAPPSEGTGQPGSKQLEGPQTPQLTIEKSAPKEIQVGKPATFTVTVRNTGRIAAGGVEVRDEIPKGTRLIGTTPRASRGVRGGLVWNLGTIQPGDESEIEIQLMPTDTGEIGSVATVSFSADASARSVATKPELVIETSAPKRVLIGEELKLAITVSNPGSGKATGVVLEEHVPAGLQHAAGSDLEYEIGDLPPGESCKLELTLVASRPGLITNVLTAHDDAVLRAENRVQLEVIAPQLDVAMQGPKRRYLEREAVYTFSVSNPGTAPAEEVELVAYLPSGLKFVSANNAGHYEEANRTVHWRLAELPTQETGQVQLVTLPVEAGQQKLRLRGTAEKGLAAEEEQPVVIEGIAAIMFEVVDVNDPVEVGGETTYEIRVLNQGSKAASNVRLQVELPRELQVVAAEGPVRHTVNAGRVLFEGLSRLAPKADTTFRVRVQGIQPGDLRVRVLLSTDEMQVPVTKEESTRVYSDE